VLSLEIGTVDGVVRAATPRRLPVALSRAEFAAILARLDGAAWLVVALRYGAGLRLQEALELRVKDVDVEHGRIVIRQGKGRKDRVALLANRMRPRLTEHLEIVRRQHVKDCDAGYGRVPLPEALDRKYPGAGESWGWQYVFPAARLCRDPRWSPPCRFHLHESAIQRAVATAVRESGITTRASCHTFRHCLRRICSRTAMTSERCRSCSVMRMSPRR